MKIGVITLFPELLEPYTRLGVVGRACNNGLLAVNCVNPRIFTSDRHQTVDDRPYGGGPGMIMRVEPLADAVAQLKSELPEARVVYMSPQGRRLDQPMVKSLAQCNELILVCGRYEGVDERFIDTCVDDEISIGDYVLSGGELAANVVIDSVARLIPGVLGHSESAGQDSFYEGLLDCPHYTRPETYADSSVPSVLLSGNHEAIRVWRLKQALQRTLERRPDLLETAGLDGEQKKFLNELLAQLDKSVST
jgi:tRNA (guanine37-N1)-methyltransferase